MIEQDVRQLELRSSTRMRAQLRSVIAHNEEGLHRYEESVHRYLGDPLHRRLNRRTFLFMRLDCETTV